MFIKTISDFRAAIRNGAYAWPGGYPMFFITADGGALSFDAAKHERRVILEAIQSNDSRSGWCVVGYDINWEDPALYCDHTGNRIESAYAENETCAA